VLDQAQSKGARAVVFDILFSDPDRLRPGGDQALEAAIRGGDASFFPVVRLPVALDAHSEIRADALRGLAVTSSLATEAPRVALVVPFMQAMLDSGRLGTHTVHLDADGKIRRFAWSEALGGGWSLRSIPAAVALHLGVPADPRTSERLIVWRRHADAYPRIPFSVAWQCAERSLRSDCPELAGRILIIGATATSLHDIKTTPLANQHMGVDILATLIDNALHQRNLGEVSAEWRWGVSVAALLFAWAVVRRGSAAATARALWALPLCLLTIGYASLHSESIYLDLSLPATAVLTFLSAVKLHDALRRRVFGLRSGAIAGPRALICAGPSGQCEQIERAVLDVAARLDRPVTGLAAAAGDCGPVSSTWVLWALPDATASDALAAALGHAVPQAWCRGFDVGIDPQRDLHAALAGPPPTPGQLAV
jgi:adenylate cyclase